MVGIVRIGPASLLLAALAGCMGGGSFAGGVTGSGVTFGVITALNDLVVAGITFDTAGASVRIDGAARQTADLRLGMVVAVRGVVDAANATGTAQAIQFETIVRGSVDSIDVSSQSFTALGQNVEVDAETVFDGVTLATLGPGDVVRLSGLLDANAVIRASRVGLDGGGGDFAIRGVIGGVDNDAGIFMIGSLIVDFGSARVDDAPPGGLVDGLLVRARTSVLPMGGTFLAERVQVKDDDLGAGEGEELKLQGFVTSLASATRFVVGTTAVRTTPATVFRDGGRADLAVNVEVESEVDSAGELVADVVDYEDLPSAGNSSTTSTSSSTSNSFNESSASRSNSLSTTKSLPGP